MRDDFQLNMIKGVEAENSVYGTLAGRWGWELRESHQHFLTLRRVAATQDHLPEAQRQDS